MAGTQRPSTTVTGLFVVYFSLNTRMVREFHGGNNKWLRKQKGFVGRRATLRVGPRWRPRLPRYPKPRRFASLRQPEFEPKPHGVQRKASSPRLSSPKLAGRNAPASR